MQDGAERQDLIQFITGSYKSSMQDGAVVDKKEPIERSEALDEDPEAAAEILIENPEAEKNRGT